MNQTQPTMQLTPKELRKLEELWLNDFHSQHSDRRNAERWFEVVMRFLNERGDEVVTNQLRTMEEHTMAIGKSREYLAALADVVKLDDARSDFDSTMLVLTATVPEREEALRRILK